MSSQLTIPVDTRPVHQSRGPDQGLHQGHQSSNFPRHQHTMSHPHGNADHFRSQQKGQGQWNGNPAFSPQGNSFPPGGANYSGHQQSNPNSHFEHRPRHNTGVPQGHRRQPFTQNEIINQSALLEELCFATLASSEIDRAEIAEKENFRQRIEAICCKAITEHEWYTNANTGFPPPSVELKCFGSLSSGFATKASDMDLGLLSPFSHIQPDTPGSPIPRLVEKCFLEAGIGARLLSRTRVPIIKLCEAPSKSLMDDLLAQREKWENGLDQDHNESNDDEELPAEQNVEAKGGDSTQAAESNPSADPTIFQILDEQGQHRFFHLRQMPKHNLAAYYGLAKRVLRKTSGRDVTMSNIREFSAHDWNVLNQVCKAFVRGLVDANLRKGLEKYQSLMFELPNNRSLLGVYIQVEGEMALQSWQGWTMADEFAALDPVLVQSIDSWYNLQRTANFGQDPIHYTKELQVSLERLKKPPAFQLLLLEQGQQETVAQYHQRAQNISNNLKLQGHTNADTLRREIVSRYIAGIHDEDIRNDIRLWQSGFDSWNLDMIGCKHKSLNLAGELQRALNKNVYKQENRKDVSKYIEVLRGSLQTTMSATGQHGFIVPIDDDMAPLIARIKALPDTLDQPRDRYRDPLEFPKEGAGVQCDINFSAHLALQNTQLLRCYSHTDPRVRAMVLFIKHWAKVRGINSGYRGTLSSYGYVLMVLHYLVNVASPFVCPNLQRIVAPDAGDGKNIYKGYNVDFWRDEQEILALAHNGQINHNQQTLGYLLRGFFEYYAQNGALSTVPGRGFDWGRDILSLRTFGGLLSKQEKGWTGAKTIYQVQAPNEPSVKPSDTAADGPKGATQDQPSAVPKGAALKEVRLRYLFAIEDPFELDHNVARTVTHNGIVSIRDEFRRAWRIIQVAGQGLPHDDLLQSVNDGNGGVNGDVSPFVQLIDEIHGLKRVSNV